MFHSVLQFWPGSAEAVWAATTGVVMSAAPIPTAAMTFFTVRDSFSVAIPAVRALVIFISMVAFLERYLGLGLQVWAVHVQAPPPPHPPIGSVDPAMHAAMPH